jgi:hypothetical protein
MIAKAIAPGSGFGGTTDDIYDGKLKTREENEKKAAVIEVLIVIGRKISVSLFV